MSDEAIDTEVLRDSFRDVLADALPLEALLGHRPDDTALWVTVTELGWPGLAIAEEYGGLGLGFDALAVLYEEAGRVLAPLPLLPCALVAEALASGGSAEQQQEWLPQLASGAVIATLSPPDERPTVQAVHNGDQLILTGSATGLVDGAIADLLLVAVELDGQTQRVLIDGHPVAAQPCYDLTRSLAACTFDDLPVPVANLLPFDVEVQISRHAAIALACEAVGGAQRILEITLDYLKMREQFGRVIGSFQALKHRAANHQTDIIAIAAITREAAAMRARGEDVACDAPAAKAYAGDVFAKIARDAVQLHGGIGVTWEHICHLYVKRAKLTEALYGSTAQQFDRLMEGLAA